MSTEHNRAGRVLGTAPISFSLLLVLLLAACSADDRGPDLSAEQSLQDFDAVTDTLASSRIGVLGQTVYVPVYSHIYHQDGTREFNLTATLSIRNTDPENAITIHSVRYYNSSGKLVRRYVDQPFVLQPLSSRPFVVEERDKAGGVGANFIVRWHAELQVSLPIIEAVMISTASTQGLSFVTRGQVVRPLQEDSDREHQALKLSQISEVRSQI